MLDGFSRGRGDVGGAQRLVGGGNGAGIGSIRELACGAFASMSPEGALRSVREGYAWRMAADPSFRHKSLLEISLAVSTQCISEVGTRG
jgi:hypothetical protein